MSGVYLKLEGSDERQQLRPGTVIREQHRYGQERTVQFIGAQEIRCVGVASGRWTTIKRQTVAKRYRIVPWPR